jgi:hypothetical protein
MKNSTGSNRFYSSSNSGRGWSYFKYLLSGIIMVFIFSIFIKLNCFERYTSHPLDSLNIDDICYFDYGKSELKPESYPLLDKVFRILQENPDYKIEVIGHTDNHGSDGFNYELSESRSLAVKEYLVSLGCADEKILIKPRGKDEPLNDNTTDEDRALNRRVIFNLLLPQKVTVVKDSEFVNSSFNDIKRNELTGEISVRDTSGNPVENLTEEDVSAVLKWKQNEIEDSSAGSVHFIPIDDKKKLAFTLTMDYSGSMYGSESQSKTTPKSDKVIEMENAVKTFIREMNNNMFCKIIKFGKGVDEIIKYSKSREVLEKAVDKASFPRGGTALYSSIYRGMIDTTFDSNPTVMKTVIAFTDGMENSSGNITLDSVYSLSNRKNVKIFTVGLFSEIPGFVFNKEERTRSYADMQNIAVNCGGFFYQANDPFQLSNIYKSIFAQILRSYQVSIIWNETNLPPKGTKVKAVIRLNVNGKQRVLYKDYLME